MPRCRAKKEVFFLRLFWLGGKTTRAVLSPNKGSLLPQCSSEEAERRLRAEEAGPVTL